MTQILILQGHPDPSKTHLCHAIADSYRKAAEAQGHVVETIEIADQDIPFLRSKEEWEGADLPKVAIEGQTAIAKAEHIVFIYPLWMGTIPAIVKAWIEQVLRHSFAFEMTRTGWKPALKGKSARLIVTMGMPAFVYRWFFFAHSLRSLERNILKFCGIKPVKWSVFGNAEDPSGKAQKSYIDKAAELGQNAL